MTTAGCIGPVIDWEIIERATQRGAIEQRVFSATQKLLQIRKSLPVLADHSNLTWRTPPNKHVAVFVRAMLDKRVYCLFNFSNSKTRVTWYMFKEQVFLHAELYDHWQQKKYTIVADNEYLVMEPYSFCIMEPVE